MVAVGPPGMSEGSSGPCEPTLDRTASHASAYVRVGPGLCVVRAGSAAAAIGEP